MRCLYTEHASSGLPNPTPLEWEVRFIQAQDQQVLPHVVTRYHFHLSQLMRLWYLSHRRPAKAKASLRFRAVSPEPLLFSHMNYGSRQRVWPKIRHLTQLDVCACVFNDMSLRKTKSTKISWPGSFDVWDWKRNSIVSVPDHFLFIYFINVFQIAQL